MVLCKHAFSVQKHANICWVALGLAFWPVARDYPEKKRKVDLCGEFGTERKRATIHKDSQPPQVHHSTTIHSTKSTIRYAGKMKDPRQGAAAIVFLVFYVLAFGFTLFCLFTRRGKRHVFCVFSFNLIRIGANIASLGWAIHLYDNFDWLVASLILGTEGE